MPKPRKKQIKPIATATIYHCKDCAKSYDWHSKALDGHLILCRCPHKQEGGRYCIFLNDPQCEHFVKRLKEGGFYVIVCSSFRQIIGHP